MSRMRNLLYGAAAFALVLVSPDAALTTIAGAASALVEATPFLLGGMLLSRLVGRCDTLAEYFGCGCGRGPSARSIPAAAATWLVFGPTVAIARFVAASCVALALHRRIAHGRSASDGAHVLGDLTALLPAAAIAGVVMQIAPLLDLHRIPPIGGAIFGAALGFVAAPCGLGAVAVASALHVRAPVASATFLCIAGILDLRATRLAPCSTHADDAFAYITLAVALGIVALRRGDALVHPAFTASLACCACAAVLGAAVYRRSRAPAARAAPALMLVGALTVAPPPYRATETTLTDLFAGERVTFTGALARAGSTTAIVRYAVTCCRADASPVALRLDRAPSYPAGTWLRVEGRIENAGTEFFLIARTFERIDAPADPFIYR
jgi:hypothetical protein